MCTGRVITGYIYTPGARVPPVAGAGPGGGLAAAVLALALLPAPPPPPATLTRGVAPHACVDIV